MRAIEMAGKLTRLLLLASVATSVLAQVSTSAPTSGQRLDVQAALARLRRDPPRTSGYSAVELALLRERYVTCALVQELSQMSAQERREPYAFRLVRLLGVLKSPEAIEPLARLSDDPHDGRPSFRAVVAATWSDNAGYYVEHGCEWECVAEPWSRFFQSQLDALPSDLGGQVFWVDLAVKWFYDPSMLDYLKRLRERPGLDPMLHVMVEFGLRQRDPQRPAVDVTAVLEEVGRRNLNELYGLAQKSPMREVVPLLAPLAEKDEWAAYLLRGLTFTAPTESWSDWVREHADEERQTWLARQLKIVRAAIEDGDFAPARALLSRCLPGDPLLAGVLDELGGVRELQADIVPLLRPTQHPALLGATRRVLVRLQREDLTQAERQELRERHLLVDSWEESVEALRTKSCPP